MPGLSCHSVIVSTTRRMRDPEIHLNKGPRARNDQGRVCGARGSIQSQECDSIYISSW